MAVKTILPVCNAYKRAQHPPIKAEVFQNVVFGQIQSRHIIGNRQILRRSFNHAPLNETSGRGPTRKLRTVSGKGPVSALRRHSTRGSGSSAHPPPTVAAKLLAGRIRPITDVMGRADAGVQCHGCHPKHTRHVNDCEHRKRAAERARRRGVFWHDPEHPGSLQQPAVSSPHRNSGYRRGRTVDRHRNRANDWRLTEPKIRSVTPSETRPDRPRLFRGRAGRSGYLARSVTADRSGFPGTSVYSMTKGAVAAMTRGLARDLGPRGITVNAIQPGPTETDMNSRARGELQ
jgi:hypothetical protein